MGMKQSDGVFAAVSKVLGEVEGKVDLTKSQKEQVHGILFQMFRAGEIDYKGGCPEDKALQKYIPGLVNNWTRKDKRLNGGTTYQTKNPGIRSGSGDASLKAMRTLLTTQTDPATRAQIQAAITARTAELKPKVEINYTALPESLQHLVR